MTNTALRQEMVKGTLGETPINSLFLDTLQEVELFTFIYLSIVRSEVI